MNLEEENQQRCQWQEMRSFAYFSLKPDAWAGPKCSARNSRRPAITMLVIKLSGRNCGMASDSGRVILDDALHVDRERSGIGTFRQVRQARQARGRFLAVQGYPVG